MARKRFETPVTDNIETVEQEDPGEAVTPVLAPKKREPKHKVPMGRITLHMERETILKLSIMALTKGREKCDIVEELLKPVVRPYVVSIRGPRNLSENEAVA